MPIIKIDRAHLAFGHHPLLAHAQFQADVGERIALIGRNGTGKSSLLSVIAGKLPLDDGFLWIAPGMRVGYVPQEPFFEEQDTVLSAVVAGMGETSRLITEYHQVSHALSQPITNHSDATTPSLPSHDELLERLSHLQQEMDSQSAWTQQSKATQVIATFELDIDAPVFSLSGGQKKRLALARALAHSPDILLLDEPTNHLDIAAIIWLEELLTHISLNKTCIIFITHDRHFLEHIATRIIELDRGLLSSFPGNFNTYVERKALMLHEENLQQARADKLLKAEEIWIRQGVEARRTRSVYRVAQLELLRQARAARRERQGRASFELDRGERSGQLVAELKHVSHHFVASDGANKIILSDFSTRIMAGDKIGLIGRNGAGKTTLLRLILGELAPTSGTVRLGTKLSVAYFDQFRSQLNLEARLQDVIGSESEFVEINGKRKHVIGYLEDFLFPPERARSQVKMLSGGERNRLLLAKLFARPANVLVLDEPTNDLDIETLELLEQLLSEYTGTVFLVSHDRRFLDNIVTQSIVFEGGDRGQWREYVGGYSDWLSQSKVSIHDAFTKPLHPSSPPSNSSLISSPTPLEESPKRLTSNPSNINPIKLSWKENKELSEIPDRIAALELEQKNLTTQLEDPSLYTRKAQEAQAIAQRISTIDEALMRLMERWEALEQKQQPR